MPTTKIPRPCQWCGAQSPAAPLFEGRYACTRHLRELLAARRRTAENDAAMEAVAETFRQRIAGRGLSPLASRPDVRAARREREQQEWVALVRACYARVHPDDPARLWSPAGVRRACAATAGSVAA